MILIIMYLNIAVVGGSATTGTNTATFRCLFHTLCLQVECANGLPVEWRVLLHVLLDHNVNGRLVVHPILADVVFDILNIHSAKADNAADALQRLRIVHWYVVAVLRTAKTWLLIVVSWSCHSSLPMPLGLVLATGSPLLLFWFLLQRYEIVLIYAIIYQRKMLSFIKY